MREQEIIQAQVTAIHDYGIEIEAEGRPGFIQPVELSWIPGSIGPSDVACVGDTIEVLVYAVTPARFFASIKQAHPELNPWRNPDVFATGTVHRGRVVQLVDWGCEVEITTGVSGMILLDKFPGDYRVGEPIEVEVIAVDAALSKIELKPR